MKLLAVTLLLAAVSATKLSYPFPESYTGRCKSLQILNGREEFKKFIEVKSLKKHYNEQRQIMNTIFCYKGDATLEVLVSERNEQPSNGQRFIWTYLNGWDHSSSKMIHSSLSKECNTVNAPSFFDLEKVNCVNLILEDNFMNGLGRATLYVLGKVPVCLSCFDIPGGFIDTFRYLSFTTKGCNETKATVFYDCPGLYEPSDDTNIFTDTEE